ncbi:MAG: hypothetical protein C5B60_04020 [Chloroflexi bacterium]|nr:MAG: hypothetical protein C5B60_04020 [Chloroflexota bacterium]
MSEDQPDTHRGDDEMEVTDLRTRRLAAGGFPRLPSICPQSWQRLILGLSLVLLVAVLLANLLTRTGALHGRPSALASPTATAMASPTQVVVLSLPPSPASSQLAPTVVPNSSVGHAVGPAPAKCSQESPALTVDGNPSVGMAIGKAPVLVGGFRGPYATLPVGPAASANLNDSGWTAPYTLYGWPAFIELIVHTGVTGPVTLSGRDAHTGYPLWFGFVMAGVWGAPHEVTPTFSLDPGNPAIPAGGSGGLEQFWYGYAFLPGAGCYTLSTSWPGGSWQITVSAGA